MSGGPHRNQDKINTIGIVVVGICGAVLVYVSITALEAFYVNDTSDVQTMADYGGQDTTAKSTRTAQLTNVGDYGANNAGGGTQTYHLKIERAMQLVVDGAKVDPGNLVPAFGRSNKSTIDPVFGRPRIAPPPAPAGATPATPPTDGGSAAPAPETPNGAGSAAPTGAGSAAPANAGSGATRPNAPTPPPAVPSAPLTPTGGAKGSPQPVPGAGSQPIEKRPPRPKGAGSGSGGHAR